jgi:hypothetical protein
VQPSIGMGSEGTLVGSSAVPDIRPPHSQWLLCVRCTTGSTCPTLSSVPLALCCYCSTALYGEWQCYRVEQQRSAPGGGATPQETKRLYAGLVHVATHQLREFQHRDLLLSAK